MVLVHGLLVILDSRHFSPVEVRRWAGPCTMGESRLTSWVEISHQVSRRHGDRYGESKDTYFDQIFKYSKLFLYVLLYLRIFFWLFGDHLRA